MHVRKHNIQTVFYFKKTVVKINRALCAENAVMRCVDSMQRNRYSATVAEVFDSKNGTLHAVISRKIKGINIIFKR